MQHSIFRPIVIGILLGSILFVASFVMIRILFVLLIGAAIFKIFSRRRMGGHFGYGFAERVRAMSEEEFEHFKGGRGHRWANHHRNNRFEDNQQEVRPIIIE